MINKQAPLSITHAFLSCRIDGFGLALNGARHIILVEIITISVFSKNKKYLLLCIILCLFLLEHLK